MNSIVTHRFRKKRETVSKETWKSLSNPIIRR